MLASGRRIVNWFQMCEIPLFPFRSHATANAAVQKGVNTVHISTQTVHRYTDATSRHASDPEYQQNRDGIATALLVEAELEYSELLGLPVGGALRRTLLEEKHALHIHQKWSV